MTKAHHKVKQDKKTKIKTIVKERKGLIIYTTRKRRVVMRLVHTTGKT